jgi:hypothetical protein
VLDTLKKTFRSIQDVPNVDELSNRSWAIYVLKLSILEAQDILYTLYPNLEVNIYYNPVKPLGKDM